VGLSAFLAVLVASPPAGAHAAPAAARLAQRNPPVGAAAPRRLYVYQSLAVTDADLARLARRLSRFGIRLPFEMSGTISARVRIGVPVRTLFDRTNYHLTGSAESHGLTVAGLRLEDLSARVAYDEGVLQLEELAFRLPAAGGLKSRLSGTATVQIFPRGDLTARLTMEQIGLDAVRKIAPEPPPGAEYSKGSISGQVNARVALDRLRNPAAWRARGNLFLNDVQALGLPPARAEAEYHLRQGTLTLTRLAGDLLGATLSGSGSVQLARPFNYNALLDISQGNLARLAELPPALRPPLALEGRYALSARVKGSLRPLSTSAAGDISVRGVNVKGVKIDTLRFNYSTDGQSLAISVPLPNCTAGGRAAQPARNFRAGRCHGPVFAGKPSSWAGSQKMCCSRRFLTKAAPAALWISSTPVARSTIWLPGRRAETFASHNWKPMDSPPTRSAPIWIYVLGSCA